MIRAVIVVLAALGAASTPVLGAELDDLGTMVAEPPTWMLDHSSGTGIRTAATGYDFVSGLGSPVADELVEELAEN